MMDTYNSTIIGKILLLLTGITSFTACTTNAPEIWSVCLRDDIGNYVIKWETDPQISGTLKVYVSNDPDSFDTSSPALYANINDGITTYITNDNIVRKYFLLSFNDKYFETVGARSVLTDSVQNLRDIGGYMNKHHKAIRWGKVFRSGQLNPLTEWDSIRIASMGIKTIIDLRTEKEVTAMPIGYKQARVINIPVSIGSMEGLPSLIVDGKIRKGDALLYMQDLYLQFVTDNTPQFAKALEVFQDKGNYPILFNCSLGKDRTGFLAALLLHVLGIPEETIHSDYLASNNYININHISYRAHDLSTDAQESITTILQANESFIDMAFRKIQKEYGSTDKYISKGLGVTEKKREHIKDILLY